MRGLIVTTFIIGCFSIIYYLYLKIYGGGAGFTIFWLLLSILSFGCNILLSKHGKIIQEASKVLRYSFITVVIILLLCFIIIESLIIKDSIKKDNYMPTDYVIVLGAGVNGTNLSLTLYNRLNVAYDYLNKSINSKAILSGGQGQGEDISEAEAMKRYLLNKGINEDRLIMENKSTSTQENISNSFKIINNADNYTVSIITSDFHVFRAKTIAKTYGKKVQGIPSKTFPPLIVNYYVREFFASVKDFVF
ncbi:MAG: YdcF family protein [Vallitalea sp.]|jgi:uncharacterized SAM-binding protein YcdF (DUF218 family)|nr:YdcF family protein [Vallitalea sp.]